MDFRAAAEEREMKPARGSRGDTSLLQERWRQKARCEGWSWSPRNGQKAPLCFSFHQSLDHMVAGEGARRWPFTAFGHNIWLSPDPVKAVDFS